MKEMRLAEHSLWIKAVKNGVRLELEHSDTNEYQRVTLEAVDLDELIYLLEEQRDLLRKRTP